MNSRVSMFPCYKWSINLSTYCSGHWGYNDEGSCQIDSRLCLYVTMTGASRRTRFSENTFTNMYIHRFGLNIIELTSVHHSCYMYDYIIKLGRFLWWLFSLNVSPCFQKHCIYKKKNIDSKCSHWSQMLTLPNLVYNPTPSCLKKKNNIAVTYETDYRDHTIDS